MHTHAWHAHVTVSAIIARKQHFLMVEEDVGQGPVLNTPAGHLESGESLTQAVIREVREETAWLFQPQYMIGIYRWVNPATHATYLRFVFTGEISQNDPHAPLDTPIICLHWMTRAQIHAQNAKLRSPVIIRSIDDYLNGVRLPLQMLQDVHC